MPLLTILCWKSNLKKQASRAMHRALSTPANEGASRELLPWGYLNTIHPKFNLHTASRFINWDVHILEKSQKKKGRLWFLLWWEAEVVGYCKIINCVTLPSSLPSRTAKLLKQTLLLSPLPKLSLKIGLWYVIFWIAIGTLSMNSLTIYSQRRIGGELSLSNGLQSIW